MTKSEKCFRIKELAPVITTRGKRMIRDGFLGALIGLVIGLSAILLGLPALSDSWLGPVWQLGLLLGAALLGGVVDWGSHRLYHHVRKSRRLF